MKIKDPKDPTKEIEVYTAEEIAAAKKGAAPDESALKVARDAAIEEFKKNNPDKSGEVERLKNELASKVAELEAAEGMNGGEAGRTEQIQRLKTAKEAAEKALTDTVKPLVDKIASMEKAGTTAARDAAITAAGVNNKEDREKVLLAFDKYDAENNTPEGIQARVTAAIGISGVKVEAAPSNMDMAGGQGGQRGNGGNQGKSVTVPENATKIGGMLGVKPEELQALADKKAGVTK